MSHWTEESIENLLYSIASDFLEQIQDASRSRKWSVPRLAKSAGMHADDLKYLLAHPGALELDVAVTLARALGLKVAVVAYDDGDATNERGPINAEIFRKCWEGQGRPANFFDLKPN